MNLPKTEKKKYSKEEGGQESGESGFPLIINRIQINDGDLKYVDETINKPVHVNNIYFTGYDIRNKISTQNKYPSPISLKANIFGKGILKMEGLLKNYIAAKAEETALCG